MNGRWPFEFETAETARRNEIQNFPRIHHGRNYNMIGRSIPFTHLIGPFGQPL